MPTAKKSPLAKAKAELRAAEKKAESLKKDLSRELGDFQEDMDAAAYNYMLNEHPSIQLKYDKEFDDTIKFYTNSVRKYKAEFKKLRTTIIKLKKRIEDCQSK